MKSGKIVMRIGAIAMLSVMSLPVFNIYAQAEDAAAFFRKDKAQWSKGHSAKPAATRVKKIVKTPRRRISAKRKIPLAGSKARFASAARRAGVPVRMALAVIAVESRGNCRAKGRRGELGPLQIKPSTARGLGYRGSNADLRSCGAGLYWGMKHLAMSWRKCRSPVLHNKGLAGSCRRSRYSMKVMRMAGRV